MLLQIKTLAACLSARMRDDRGVVPAEYLGLIVVIGIILAAVVANNTAIADAIRGGVVNAVNSVFGRTNGDL